MKKKSNRFVLGCLLPGLMLALFLGCDNGNDNEPGGDTPIEVPVTGVQVYLQSQDESTSEYTGSGVVKISYYNEEEQSTQTLDAGKIEEGKLTLKLPESVPEEALELMEEEGVTISPADIKILEVYGFDVFVGNTFSYSLYYEKGENMIMYFYSSEAAKVTGTSIYKSKDEDWTDTETYNLDLKKGWNAVYMHYEEKGNTETSTFTTDGSGMPSGMKWVLSPR
jgi:hypothetical protein